MTDVKTFKEAFPAVILNEETAAVFNGTSVISVTLNKNERVLKIALNAPFGVSENAAADLKAQLILHMPFISDVLIDLNRTTAGAEDDLNRATNDKAAETDADINRTTGGTNDALSGSWDAVVDIIGETNPLCARILQDSSRTLSGRELTLNISHNGSFVFVKRGIDKKIAEIINEKFGLDVYVKCVDDVSKKTKNVKNHITYARAAHAPPPAVASPKPKSKTVMPENPKPNGRGKKVRLNNSITGNITDLSQEIIPEQDVFIRGKVLSVDKREIKTGGLLVTFDITDFASSVTVKFFTEQSAYKSDFESLLKPGNFVAVLGAAQYDTYTKEVNIKAKELGRCEDTCARMDLSEHKRVELHLHTQMSALDGVTSAAEYIKRAALWGHKAVAITDHGVVQAFPEAAAAAKKHGIKVIYGMEAYLVDDMAAARVVDGDKNTPADGTFVAFDLETTGLNPKFCKIIEIGAVRIENFAVKDTFNILCDPQEDIPYNITELTGITNKMVKGQPLITQALGKFFEFAGDAALIAHNAAFDAGFLTEAAKTSGMDFNNTVIDTLKLSQCLYPKLKKHNLKALTEHLNVELSGHHRASADAAACAGIFIKMAKQLVSFGIHDTAGYGAYAVGTLSHKALKHSHAIILVKNMTGLRNLYELVSESHLSYFYMRPRILKSRLTAMRQGLIIGSACEAGELYRALIGGADEKRVAELADFYDYYEIQPRANNMFLVRNGKAASENGLLNINREIVQLGRKYNKPVVATCDAHFLNPSDEIIRRMILYGEGYKDTDFEMPLFFRTTEEMLAEFSYLGPDAAREVVIENTNKIADMTEVISPIPDGTFPPVIEGAEDEIKTLATKRAIELYGEPIPHIVAERLDRELTSIIKNGFSVMYLIAQKLVAYSEKNGYMVGSRGSVGSSFVAAMTGITEVNPLSPHYLCPVCKYSDFESDIVLSHAGGSGCDMPDKNCPICGSALLKDGHDIPFETFLGFDGDKEPDIDLNFSGEFQARAHAYTEELFGEGNVFKAGTIGTFADKNAYAVVKKYMDEKHLNLRTAEVNRLKAGCVGVKKTTGQHPGGLMILPKGHSIYEFTPVQRPANDTKSNVTTTHFDYHSMGGNLFKLDLLGHDVPTIIRMLYDFTGVNPQEVNIGDRDIISLFANTEALGVTENDINCKTGSLGLPEFGTSFVRQMLIDSKPSSFAELVRISGLSHGTDVWLNNAQDLIKNGQATLKTIIPTRDDIMLYLISRGVDKKTAFKIMENVRKGKGLTDAEIKTMRENSIPEWYIMSCQKIKYLFPKSHAAAYVMMTMRIGYYKIHHPYAFYAAVLSVRAEDFDYEMMCFGRQKVFTEMSRINALSKDDASAKDKNSLTALELVLEFYARGLSFVRLDLYTARADKFLITNEGLMAPLCSIQGLGITAAESVVTARQDGEFETLADFRQRTSVNKTVTELLKRVGVLDGLTESNQMSLFE